MLICINKVNRAVFTVLWKPGMVQRANERGELRKHSVPHVQKPAPNSTEATPTVSRWRWVCDCPSEVATLGWLDDNSNVAALLRWFVTAKPLTMFWLIWFAYWVKRFDCLSRRVWKSPQSHWMMRQITSLTCLKAASVLVLPQGTSAYGFTVPNRHLHAIPFRQLGVRLFVVGFLLRQWNPQRRLKHPWQKVFWWFGTCALMPALPVRIVLMDA